MATCWCYDPKDRPSFDILVENIDSFIQKRLDNVSITGRGSLQKLAHAIHREFFKLKKSKNFIGKILIFLLKT